jgi:hypothetical protein
MPLQRYHQVNPDAAPDPSDKFYALENKGGVPTAVEAAAWCNKALSGQVVLVVDEGRSASALQPSFEGLDVVLCGDNYTNFFYNGREVNLPKPKSDALPYRDACLVAQYMVKGDKEGFEYMGYKADDLLKAAGLM